MWTAALDDCQLILIFIIVIVTFSILKRYKNWKPQALNEAKANE